MKLDPIVREISYILIAPMLLFALYVQFHGDFGPGGGFQAGVIFAAAIILHALVNGLADTQRRIPLGVMQTLAALGVLIYAGTGVACMMKGGAFLDYNVLAHDPHHGQHWGIFAIELGVGVTVCSAMVVLFYAFAGRGNQT